MSENSASGMGRMPSRDGFPGELLCVLPHGEVIGNEGDGCRYVTSDELLALVNNQSLKGTCSRVMVDGRALEMDFLAIMHGVSRLAGPDAVLVIQAPVRNPHKPLIQLAITDIAGCYGWVPAGLLPDRFAPFPGDCLAYRRDSLPSRYQLSVPVEADTGECHGLFERAFGTPADPLLWEWKYGGGRGVSIIARRSGNLVAHYGCVARQIRFRGQDSRAVQICDVMVDPDERGLMTKTGAFFQAARVSQDLIIGLDGRFLLGFGFPNQRHMLLGSRAGLYAEVEKLMELRFSGIRHVRSWSTTVRPVTIANCERQIVTLWEQMAHDLKDCIVGVRDPAYLGYRYESHPGRVYELFMVQRRWGTPLGLLVLRREEGLCRLIDVVGPVAHLPLLLQFARSLTAAMGLKSLVFWITSSQVSRFAAVEAEIEPLDIRIPANQYVARVDVADLAQRWWLMMGDTDFM